MMKRIFISLLLFCVLQFFANELSLEDFLARSRYAGVNSSFIAVKGKAEHLRKGSDIKSSPIYFAMILQPERMTGQILIGEDEGYYIGQDRTGKVAEASLISMNESQKLNMLGEMGINPSDLSMSFMFFSPLKEEESSTVRLVPCRVVLMESPDKKEFARVFIAKDQYFPLKAEFIKKDSSNQKPYRTLEVNAFAKENNLYYASELSIYGPGWRSRIKFDKPLSIGEYQQGKTKNIFRKLGEIK